VPVAVVLGFVQATLAVGGFDVMRFMVRIVLPISLAATAALITLFVASGDPRFGTGRVFDSPDQKLTWVGFATTLTVMAGATMTFVTNIADFCRYTPTRRAMRTGFVSSALLSVTLTTFLGAYVAVAAGSAHPYAAATELTASKALLAFLLLAVMVQSTSVNQTNVYSAGMSLVNAVPRLRRLWSTVAAAALAVTLSAFPDLIDRAGEWITHLGNVAAPLTGVVFADYVLVQRCRLDVPALFEPRGRYRYLLGVNLAAVAATACGVGVYYAIPDELLKVAWGVAVGGVAYVIALRAQRALAPRTAPTSVAEERLMGQDDADGSVAIP
jgi:purine-cytosine permease-like protein